MGCANADEWAKEASVAEVLKRQDKLINLSNLSSEVACECMDYCITKYCFPVMLNVYLLFSVFQFMVPEVLTNWDNRWGWAKVGLQSFICFPDN